MASYVQTKIIIINNENQSTKNDNYQCHITQNIQINSNLKNKIKEKTSWQIITRKIDLLKE